MALARDAATLDLLILMLVKCVNASRTDGTTEYLIQFMGAFNHHALDVYVVISTRARCSLFYSFCFHPPLII